MRRPWNGAMRLTLTLPLRLERRPRVRQQRRRRVAVCVLIALGVALLAAVFRLPARAARAQPLPSGAAQSTTVGKAPATLAVGDELMLERPDGAIHAYEVASLDVIASRRTELALDADESVVVLVTDWPCENMTVGGSWRYVVTARSSF